MAIERRTSHPNLIERAIALVQGFNPATQTGDSYAEDALGGGRPAEEINSDVVFLKQVFYGCVRYKDAIRVFLKHYYNDMAGIVLRSDFTLYMILAYLLLFRLDEMGFDDFRHLTRPEDPTKIAHLLKYLTDWHRVEGQLTQDWLTIFDLKYINDVMLGGLRRASGVIRDYCEKLELKAFASAQDREEKRAKAGKPEAAEKTVTVPRPFNLTKPKPRRVPEPIKIEQAIVVGPSTDRLYKTTLAEVEAAKRERLETLRRETVEKYREVEKAGQGEFRLNETRNTKDALKEEAERRLAEELQFDRRFTNQVPKYREENAQVRLNAAAILREDALLKRRQEQDAQLIKSFEAELRDSTEFYQWQTDMRERDAALIRERVGQKRAYAKASQQAAREALEMQRAANSELVLRMRAEKESMQEQRHDEEELEISINRCLVKEVAEVRNTAPKDSVQRVLDEKRLHKEKLCNELEALRSTRRREIQEEQAARKESVLKLKEQEVHERHVKVFDPTESAGVGLLDEMSHMETKARLEANRRHRAKAEAERRKDIIIERAERQADLRERLEAINERRAAAKQAKLEAAQERKERDAARAEADRLQRERASRVLIEELQRKRQARESELKKLPEEEESRMKAALYLGRGTAAVEERKFRQLLRGAEREAERRQRVAREVTERRQKVLKEEKKQVTDNARKKQAATPEGSSHGRSSPSRTTGRRVRMERFCLEKQKEFNEARNRFLEDQRQEMRQKQEKFKAAKEKVKASGGPGPSVAS